MLFSRLLEPGGYTPALWDLGRDPVARAHWQRVFRLHLDDLRSRLSCQRGAGNIEPFLRARGEFVAWLDRLDDAALLARPHVHSWTCLREELFRRHGVRDPYQEVKAEEDERALLLLPEVLASLRAATSVVERLRLAIAGVFAGNLFDLGSPLTAEAHRQGQASFAQLRDRALGGRWLHDHLDQLLAYILTARPGRAVILADNAGQDFVCGILPLAALLAAEGMEVVLAANQHPSLNDVTIDESRALLAAACARDGALAALVAAGRLVLVSTGTGTPGIDLTDVSPALDEAATAADLLVIEGQGRAIETNWHARFDRVTLRLSALKDPLVAAHLGGKVYDLVCDLRAPGGFSPGGGLVRPPAYR